MMIPSDFLVFLVDISNINVELCTSPPLHPPKKYLPKVSTLDTDFILTDLYSLNSDNQLLFHRREKYSFIYFDYIFIYSEGIRIIQEMSILKEQNLT